MNIGSFYLSIINKKIIIYYFSFFLIFFTKTFTVVLFYFILFLVGVSISHLWYISFNNLFFDFGEYKPLFMTNFVSFDNINTALHVFIQSILHDYTFSRIYFTKIFLTFKDRMGLSEMQISLTCFKSNILKIEIKLKIA